VDPLHLAGRCGGGACGRGIQCSVLAKARLPLGHLRLRLRCQLIARATYLAKLRFADSAQREGNGATDWRGWEE